MSYPHYPNLYPQFAHDPLCRCCHPNDRPYCDCPCHRANTGEITALRARWDIEGRIPMGEAIALTPRPLPKQAPIAPAEDARLASLPGKVAS